MLDIHIHIENRLNQLNQIYGPDSMVTVVKRMNSEYPLKLRTPEEIQLDNLAYILYLCGFRESTINWVGPSININLDADTK